MNKRNLKVIKKKNLKSFCTPGGTRTHTYMILSHMPLPIGLQECVGCNERFELSSSDPQSDIFTN